MVQANQRISVELIFAFYPGCLVLQRMPEYELATRAVLSALGIELNIVQQAACCGSPVVESFTTDWVYLAAYNLALVERMGHDVVVTVCGGCTNTLARGLGALQNPDVRAEANRRLDPLGLSVAGRVAVKHLVQLLAEREDDVKARIVRPPFLRSAQNRPLRVALTNPCQAFRPGDVMGTGGDDPMEPQRMRRLVELTGVEVVEYGGEDECCDRMKIPSSLVIKGFKGVILSGVSLFDRASTSFSEYVFLFLSRKQRITAFAIVLVSIKASLLK